jgi:hypothetical protein
MDLKTLRRAVGMLCDIVDQLGTSFPPPKLVPHGDGVVDRHDVNERDNSLACYLKAVKTCSTLSGAITLVASAQVQEAYALCRMAQDQIDDIHFLIHPKGEGDAPTTRQNTALNEFYQEEYEDPTDPVATSKDRVRVGRQKIQAAIHSDLDDPSTAQAISTSLYRTFSGYVHGAYVHVMELHSDTPGRYHMRGVPSRVQEAIEFIPNYVYRAMMAVEVLAAVSGRTDLFAQTKALRTEFAELFDLLPPRKV